MLPRDRERDHQTQRGARGRSGRVSRVQPMASDGTMVTDQKANGSPADVNDLAADAEPKLLERGRRVKGTNPT